MTIRRPTAARALEVVLPVAAIVAGSFSDIEWLSLAGTLGLGLVIANGLLRDPPPDTKYPPLRGLWFALGTMVAVGAALIPLVLYEPAGYILLPALALGLAATYGALLYIIWWLIRLNSA